MGVTAKEVKVLRDATGAGMLDCKKALTESDGDIDVAKTILREKGLAAANKRAGHAANEGLIEARVSEDGRVGVMVELSSETDFVAKGGRFAKLAAEVTGVVYDAGGDIDDSVRARIGALIEDAQVELREKIEFKRAIAFDTSDGVIDAYLHKTGGWSKMGVLVELVGAGIDPVDLRLLAHELALHIQFARPSFLGADEIDDELLDSERAIAEAKARNDDKPDELVARISDGAIKKLFKQCVLLEQPYIKDDKRSVEKWLAAQSDGKAEIVRFARFEIGEVSESGES